MESNLKSETPTVRGIPFLVSVFVQICSENSLYQLFDDVVKEMNKRKENNRNEQD